MVVNMLTEVRRRIHKQSKIFSIEKIPGITVLENTISELKSSTDVIPDVPIPERKREGLQDNATHKKESLLLTRDRAPAASNAVVRSQRAPSPSYYTNL